MSPSTITSNGKPRNRHRALFEAIVLACAAAIVIAIGWSRIYDPFAGDQALFLVGAEKLRAGGALYRDFWDIKQPGVFAFFLLGGRVFGFDQIGEHAADLAWQIVFSAALVAGLRSCFPRYRAVVAFAPLAVVGAYYAGSSSWHLLQVEELVGLPTFACAWLLIEARRRSSRRLAFAAGVCGGIVLAFKLVFVVIVAGLAVAVLAATREKKAYRSSIFPWAAGLSAPMAVVAVYAMWHSTERLTLETTFVIPVQVLLTADMHAPAGRLADSASRFALYFRGAIVLALIGFFTVDRTSAAMKTWRLVCGTWIVCAAIAVAVQISSWWQYHFLLFVPPVGILATFGLASFVRAAFAGPWKTAGSLAALGLVAYVAVPLPQGAIGTIVRVAEERPYASRASLERYRNATNSEYADAFEESALLKRRAAGASVYVFGDPLIYLDADTPQAIAMNSWGIQLFTPALWRRTTAELCTTRPDYVFVFDRFVDHLQRGDDGATMTLLAREYQVAGWTPHGEWYRRIGSRRTSVCAAPRTARDMASAQARGRRRCERRFVEKVPV